MNSFLKNALIVATIVLIIALTLVGVVIANDNSQTKFPPRVDSCPDYWVHASYLKDPSNKINLENPDIELNSLTDECVNIKNLGSCNPKEEIMNFNKAPYNNSGDSGSGSGVCAKYKWAKHCNITWDGITNKDDVCND
tara:strand:- start:260 stop:673 length:414 start_codon:yes stop_codon:yes gene_type:complete